MNIVEKLIESKTMNQIDCEDGLFINENFVAVIDGATSKGEIVWDGKLGGRYIKDVIIETLSKLDEDMDAKEAFKMINDNIKISYKDNYEIAKANPQERLEASIIIFNRKKQEIWSLGDCQCMINNNLYIQEKKIDTVLSEVRSLYIKLSLLEGKTKEQIVEKDVGKEFILPILNKQTLFSNSNDPEYGFALLDGFDINFDDIKIYKVKKGDEIIFASDGYPELKNTLEASEIILEEMLKTDPLLINRFKSTKCLYKENKSFDDRTYVKFTV